MSQPTTRVLVADAEFAAAAQSLQSTFPQLQLSAPATPEELPALLQQPVDVIIAASARIDTHILDQVGDLTLLLKLGRLYDNIDAEAVRARRIPFGFVPRKGPNCVAELAQTFIMALSKDLLNAHRAVEQGAYRLRGLRPKRSSQTEMAFRWMQPVSLHEVSNRTLGIVGFGEIAAELARRVAPLDMRVLYYKRTPLNDELEQRFGASYADLDTLLSVSDYVCVAVPQTPQTEGLINAERLRQMKPEAYLINICRGAVVDEAALIEALQNGTIAGAGLDVFTYEPLPADSPLTQLHNVILTPHIGGGTGTTRANELEVALQTVQQFLNGEPLRYSLNSG